VKLRVVALVSALALLPSAALAASAAELRQARVDAAARAHGLASAGLSQGATTAESVYQWSLRWLHAARAQAGDVAGKLAAARAHLERMRALEATVRGRVEAGLAPPLERHAAEYYRIEAELWASGEP
jgi:hypothetical protein